MSAAENKTLSIELLIGQSSGKTMMAVPLHCGLKEADTLLLSGNRAVVMKDNVVLGIHLPVFTPNCVSKLRDMALKNTKLPVGEFLPTGIADAYSLSVQVSD